MKTTCVLFPLLVCCPLNAREERDWVSLETWRNQELTHSHGMKSISVDEIDDYAVSVTYALDGGRLGDQFTGYLKALWISYKYNVSLIYRSFDYSDQFVFFAKEYPDLAISQWAVGQIPWGHNILLLQRLKSIQERPWYANKTIALENKCKKNQ